MGHFLKIKCVDSRVNVHMLASTIISFTLTTVQVPKFSTNSHETHNSGCSNPFLQEGEPCVILTYKNVLQH
jgi:hypothetical protein